MQVDRLVGAPATCACPVVRNLEKTTIDTYVNTERTASHETRTVHEHGKRRILAPDVTTSASVKLTNHGAATCGPEIRRPISEDLLPVISHSILKLSPLNPSAIRVIGQSPRSEGASVCSAVPVCACAAVKPSFMIGSRSWDSIDRKHTAG